jgi:hypothetical protein
MKLLQFVTAAGALIVAAPAFAQTGNRVVCNAPYTAVRLSNKEASDLHQNSPNPFTHQTTISYKIPDRMKEAQLVFYDVQGKLVKAVDITRTAVGGEDVQCTGQGGVTVFGDGLRFGSYTYVLVVDGQVVGSKTMMESA